MAPVLRAAAARLHPFLPRQPLPDPTTIFPNTQSSGGSVGFCSSCHCLGLSSSHQFPQPPVSPTPTRGLLPWGPRLGSRSPQVAPLQAVGGGGCFAAATAGGTGGGFLCLFLSWYLNALNKYPVSMKSVTSAFLNLVGDLICQRLIDQVPELDLKRTFVFTFLGLVLVGPTLHFWYLYLSKLVTLQGPSGALVCLLLDQFIFAPMFIGVFLSSLVTLEGRLPQLVPKLRQEWFSSVVANWKLWIPFQFLNFWFVPQQFQVLAANFVALVWNVILSFKAHKEIKREPVTE